MRVLIVSDSYPPQPDGIAQSTVALSQGLEELGHEVTVVVPGGAEAGAEHVHIVRAAPFQISSYPVALASRRALSRMMRSVQPDIVHVQTLAGLGLMATISARCCDIPAVLTWHTDLLAYRESFPALNAAIPAGYLMWRSYSIRAIYETLRVGARVAFGMETTAEHTRMLAAVLSTFNTVIAPSAKAAGQVQQILGAQAEIEMIPSAVPAEVPMSAADAGILMQLRKTLPGAGQRIIFIGRLSPEKNLDTLLSVLRHYVLPCSPEVELMVVGADPTRDRRYEKLAAELGVGSSVRFMGRLPNSVVRQLLVDCTALVMPSRTETQGLVVQEAAMAGIPAVILDDSLEDLVVHEKTGLVANSAEEFGASICRLVSDPELRSRLGEGAKKSATLYSPLEFASRTVQSYRASQALHAGSHSQLPGRPG